MLEINLVESIKKNPVLNKPVFKKYQGARYTAVLSQEPYFQDTKNIDTEKIREARKANLLWKQKHGVLSSSNLNNLTCSEYIKPILDKYQKDIELCHKDGVGFLIMGLPGSGKTTAVNFIEDLGILKKEFANKAFRPNADELKLMLPGYDKNINNTEYVHEVSVNYFKEEVNKAMEVKANVIVELSGGYFDYLNKYIKRMSRKGYKEINIFYVDVEPINAMKRVALRLNKTGRFLDPKVIYYASKFRDKKTESREYNMHPADNYMYLFKLKEKGILCRDNKDVKINLFWVDNKGKKPSLIDKKSSYTLSK